MICHQLSVRLPLIVFCQPGRAVAHRRPASPASSHWVCPGPGLGHSLLPSRGKRREIFCLQRQKGRDVTQNLTVNLDENCPQSDFQLFAIY